MRSLRRGEPSPLRRPHETMTKKKANPQKRGPKPLHSDAALMEQLFSSLQIGLSEAESAEVVGIDEETLRRWKKKPEIGGAIKKAILEGKKHHLQRIFLGVPGWQSSAWFLERKYRSEFGRDVSPPPQAAVTVRFEGDDE